MNLAADAVADFIAPPPARSATARTDVSGPSFDDHLQAAQDARDAHANDVRDTRETARADQADHAADRADQRADDADRADDSAPASDQTQETTNPDGAAHAHPEPETHASHAPQTPAPLLVQLIAANAPQTPAPVQAPAQTSPAIAANATAPPPEAPVIVAATTPATPNTSNAAKKTSAASAKDTKAEAAPATSDATAPQTDAIAAPVKPSEPQRPPQVSADADDAATPVTSAPTRGAPARPQKSDAGAKAPTQPASARPDDAADSAPATANNAKPNVIARAAVAAAQTADTPTPPAPSSAASPAPAAASIQMPAATQHVSAPDQSGLRTAPISAQVGHEIVRRFDGGNTSFDIRLDPPELGRVDVRLEVSRDQRVSATISADTPQALHELARHARDLEQTLQSAGLELSDSGLSFDLRQGSDGRARANDDSATPSASARADAATTEQTPVARPRLEGWRGVRVDMMV